MELLLRFEPGDGTRTDLVLDCAPDATVGAVADRLAARVPGAPSGLTLAVVGRDHRPMSRPDAVTAADMRSGDTLRLAAVDPNAAASPTLPAAIVVHKGPDAGRTFPLRFGPNTVGRDSANAVALADPLTSRTHVRITVGDAIELVDLGSTNGAEVDGRRIHGSVLVEAGQTIAIGDTEFSVERQPHVTSPGAVAIVAHNAPPRVFAPFEGEEHEFPRPPDPPQSRRFPWLSALAPVVAGVAMFVITKRPYVLIFILLSPVILVGNALETRRSAKADHEKATEQWKADRADLINRIAAEHGRERASRHEEAPSIARCASFVRELSTRLWERDRRASDVLLMRVGSATQPTRSKITTQHGGPRDERLAIEAECASLQTIPDLPAVAPLLDAGSTGIAGGPAGAAVARSLIIQAATLHSPAQLAIAAVVGPHTVAEWEWLKWLPHTRQPGSPLRGPHLAAQPAAAGHLLDRLYDLLEQRADEGVPPWPRVLLLFADPVPLERSSLTRLIEEGPRVGIHTVWLSETQRALPGACGATVVASGSEESSWVGFSADGSRVNSVTTEGVTVAEAEAVARWMAPVVDISARPSRDVDLADAVSLVDVLGDPSLLERPELVTARWAQSQSLRAVIGALPEAPLSLDLRSDGPHALVAGTTGAGKSELLQTLVASLALTHSPERITFLLVDYKGGAAFKDCVRLPHTVGFVTDLNTHLVRRALVSLEAELHRRERILAAHGAKDLPDLEAKAPSQTPPSLLIVVDEFASLAREVPEFVEGVVNVSQRGRSLGLHLVLATQRPAGVVTENIRANTNLRIALRVAGENDSLDVIGIRDAAVIDRGKPGRAIAKVGPRELLQFQTGYVGGRTTHDMVPPVELGVAGFEGVEWEAKDAVVRDEGEMTGPTDLERIVDVTVAATRRLGLADPHRPWLDPLPDLLDLEELPASASAAEVVIARSDLPSKQRQEAAAIRFASDGSLLVYGASRSGKTVLLRTIAASLALQPEPSWIYAIDAGRGLTPIDVLPGVGAVVPVDDHERVVRLLKMLEQMVADRRRHLAEVGVGDLSELRDTRPDDVQPRVFLLVDGFTMFRDAFEKVDRGQSADRLVRIIADGRAAGVHVVMSADRRGGVPSAITGIVPARVVLRMASEDELMNVGLRADAIAPDAPPGRGYLGDLEIQVAMLGGSESGEAQTRALSDLAERVTIAVPPPEVRTLPDEVDLTKLPKPARAWHATVGVESETLTPLDVDLSAEHHLVFGPPRSGRTSALITLAASTSRARGAPYLFVAAPRIDGELAELPWTGTAAGSEETIRLLEELATSDPAQLGNGALVFIDDAMDFPDGSIDAALTNLVKGARERPIKMVIAADGTRARRAPFTSPMGELRGGKHGLLLNPDVDTDGDLLGARLPKSATLTFGPGRGYYVTRGSARIVQVARLPITPQDGARSARSNDR